MSSPMGVSQWKKHGKKHGYWKYFTEENDAKWRARIEGEKRGDIHQPNCISKTGVNNCDCATYHVNQALDNLLKE